MIGGTYDRWRDDELLEEADERDLNSKESDMLDSMMQQVGYDPKTKRCGRALTYKQRAWLINLLETTTEARD